MQVVAKCIMPAWDSVACMPYSPGQGPFPGGLYEIDRDGPLAKLMTTGGRTAKYVFEFDRNAGPDDKPHDYSCKRDGCGKKFKSLAALGTHTKTDHKGEANPLAEPDAEVFVIKSRQGKHKNRTFTCKEPGCGEVLPHLYALKVHKKTHVKVAVEEAA